MTDAAPLFNQVNIIARDWQASLAFYRLLGFALDSGGEYPPGSGARHASAACAVQSTTVEFDSPPMLRIYATPDHDASAVLGFGYPSAAAVDAACSRVAAAGHRVIREPYDAFWGARYALVADPDGNTIGLMGPRDRPGYVPSVPS